MKKIYIFPFVFALFFLVAPRALAWHDLSVTGIAISPSEPAQNQPCTITATVKYEGDVSLTAMTGLDSYTYNFSGFELTKTTVPAVSYASPLAPDKSVKYIFTGSFPAIGEKNLTFKVNENGALSETKPLNNYLTVKISVVKPLDLKLESISVLPKAPAAGQEAIITVKAKNNGYASLFTGTGITSIFYNFAGFTVDKTTAPQVDSSYRLASGDYFYYIYRGSFGSIGEKEMSFTIDAADQLDERDESNNIGTLKINVVSQDDINLSLSSLSINIAKPIIDEEVAITAILKNNGPASVNDKTGLLAENDLTVFPNVARDIRFNFPDFTVTKIETGDFPTADTPLEPGKTFLYKFTGAFSVAGFKKLEFTANANKRLKEKDYADNGLAKEILIFEDAADRDSFAILSHEVDYLSSREAEISWETSENTTGRLEYKQANFTSYSFNLPSSSATKNHKLKLSGLNPGTKYEYKITGENKQVIKTVVSHFIVPASDQLIFSGEPGAAVDGAAAAVSWMTNLASKGTVFYNLSLSGAAYKQAAETAYASRHELTLKDLPAGNYSYYIAATSTPGTTARTGLYGFIIAATAADGGESPAAEQQESVPEQKTGGQTEAPATAGSESIAIKNSEYYKRLNGKIILKVESAGEAYYISPGKQEMYYLGRPADAFAVMRGQGIGIKNSDLEKIPIGLKYLTGPDSDSDGLPDMFEDALGTDKNKKDTDNDGYSDYDEIASGHDPLGPGKAGTDAAFAARQAGKIFLQVESKGEAWYINPADNKRYFLGRPADAFAVMRYLGLGISNGDFVGMSR